MKLSKSFSLKWILFILLTVILFYWPMSFMVFSVKNDILTDYFPTRFFISEALQSGYIPWWNPYVNFGIPQYADMNSGFWNPVTWVISLTSGYNIYSITWELLIYVAIGGAGIFHCRKIFQWDTVMAWIAAVSYIGCGFVTGHLQHLNWISATAFLPWCVYFLHQLMLRKNIGYLFKLPVFLYLYISSSHPGLIIGGLYFFFICAIIFIGQKENRDEMHHILVRGLIVVIILLLLSAGLIYSYMEVLPFTGHHSKPLPELELNATNLRSWMSFLYPFSSYGEMSWWKNDITLRSCYIGLIPFIFSLYSWLYGLKKAFFWWLTGFFFLMLSSDLLVMDKVRNLLPLTGYVRLVGEFRIFTLFSWIIAAMYGLQNFRSSISIESIIVFSVIYWSGLAALFIWMPGELSIDQVRSFVYAVSTGDILKWKELLNIKMLLLLQLSVSIILFAGYAFMIRKKSDWGLASIATLDIFIAAMMALPFTGVGQKSPAYIQSLVSKSSSGIPVPELVTLGEYDFGNEEITRTIGHWSYYNKQPGTLSRAGQPLIFSSEFQIFSDSVLEVISQRPFLYVTDTMDGKNYSIPHLKKFSPNQIEISYFGTDERQLLLLYKPYLHWVYSVNGNACKALTASSTIFPAIPLNKGISSVIIKFKPRVVQILWVMTILMLVMSISIVFIFKWKSIDISL